MAEGQLRITLVRGLAGKRRAHKEVARALGLRRTGQTVVRTDTPAVRGQIRKIAYLVRVESA